MKALRDRNLMFDPDVDVYDYLKKHQQRMRDVQCKIDCTAPRENEVLVSNYTDKRTVQDSKRRIDRQNTVLVNSLFRIMEGSRPTPSTSAATNDYKIATEKKLSKQHPGTLNYSKRVRDAQKIHEKNIIIASRLESIKPVYSIEDLTNKTINIKRNSRLYTTTGINPYNASTGMNLEDANSTPFSSSGLTAFKLEHKDDLDELLNVVATNGNQSRPSSSAALRPANYRKTTRIYSTVPYASPLRPHSAPTFASSTPHATTPKKLDLIKQYHSLPCQPNNRQNSNLSSGLEMPSTDLRPYYANDLDAPNSVTSVRSSVVEGSISNATINRLSAPSPHKRYDTNDNTNPGYYNLSDKESHTVNACKFGTGDRFYNDKEEPVRPLSHFVYITSSSYSLLIKMI